MTAMDTQSGWVVRSGVAVAPAMDATGKRPAEYPRQMGDPGGAADRCIYSIDTGGGGTGRAGELTGFRIKFECQRAPGAGDTSACAGRLICGEKVSGG